MPVKKKTKSKTTTAKAAKPKPVETKVHIRVKIAKPERTDVFISYSHADKEWLTRLQVHLKPLGRDHKVSIWDDTKLRGGDKWKSEIDKALAKAKVAILLVSADFLASDFIHNNELPPLLQASEKEGLIILSIIVSHSGAFYKSLISQYQAINEPALPLNTLDKGQSEQVFSQVFNRVYSIFVEPPTKAARRVIAKTPKLNEADEVIAKQTGVVTVKNPAANKSASTVKNKTINNGQKGLNKALLVKRNGEWAVITVTKSELAIELNLVLKSANSNQKAFLSSLRQRDQLSSIVLGNQTHICKNTEIYTKTEGMQETWHLKADLQQQSNRAEITYSSITPNKLAELRTRLLLLNEPLPSEQSSIRFFGNNMIREFDTSPLPALYQQLNKQAAPFKQAAPLIAAWFLQINNIVEHILKLTLTLKSNWLTVQFEGQRNRQYENDAPAIIRFEGKCNLSVIADENVLLLGPLSRY